MIEYVPQFILPIELDRDVITKRYDKKHPIFEVLEKDPIVNATFVVQNGMHYFWQIGGKESPVRIKQDEAKRRYDLLEVNR